MSQKHLSGSFGGSGFPSLTSREEIKDIISSLSSGKEGKNLKVAGEKDFKETTEGEKGEYPCPSSGNISDNSLLP